MHYDEGIMIVIVIAVFWLIGLALCIGVPMLIVKMLNLKVSLWTVSLVGAVAWIAGTYIWYNLPM